MKTDIPTNMYATISQILYPNRLGLVGTPDQVAERIDEFEEAGVDLLLLQCSPQLEEMERFAAEVIRKVHPIRNISV